MLKFEDVTKKYGDKVVLDDVSFEIQTGEFVFLVGPSGCGKTTAFRLIIKEEEVTRGRIFIDEYEITKLKRSLLSELRRQIGVVFQDYKLIPNKNVYENIAFALELMGKHDKEIETTVNDLLELVNLKDRKEAFPDQLSGGEKQKVSIARAMANGPLILLADEPTGNLDPVATWEVVDILKKINEKGTTVIMATHEVQIVKAMNKRVLEIKNGKMSSEGTSDQYVTSITMEQKEVKMDIENRSGGHTLVDKSTNTEVTETAPVEPNIELSKGKTKKWKEWFDKDTATKEEDVSEPKIDKKEIEEFIEEEKKNAVKVDEEIQIERKDFEVKVEEKIENKPLVQEEKIQPVPIFKRFFSKSKVETKIPEKVKPEETPKVETPKPMPELPKSKIKVSVKPRFKKSESSDINLLDIPLKTKDILLEEGYDSIEKLLLATADELSNLDGVGVKGYEKIKKALKSR